MHFCLDKFQDQLYKGYLLRITIHKFLQLLKFHPMVFYVQNEYSYLSWINNVENLFFFSHQSTHSKVHQCLHYRITQYFILLCPQCFVKNQFYELKNELKVIFSLQHLLILQELNYFKARILCCLSLQHLYLILKVKNLNLSGPKNCCQNLGLFTFFFYLQDQQIQSLLHFHL